MKLSKSFFYTLRENAKDEDSVFQQFTSSCWNDQKKAQMVCI